MVSFTARFTFAPEDRDEIAEALHYISTSATKFERLIDASYV